MDLNKEKLQNLRQEYRTARLSAEEMAKDPVNQFENWFKDALDADLFEPNVMTLATVGEHGKPAARIVLLKGIEEGGFVFFTNYNSDKGRQMDENPFAALVFFWAELERQVRIEGRVSKITAEDSTAYFHSRPRGSQIGAMASPQSQVIQDRTLIENKVLELEKQYAGNEIPRPDHWGGYRLMPQRVEFWQGRPSRLHDRIVYEFVDGSWIINRLAP